MRLYKFVFFSFAAHFAMPAGATMPGSGAINLVPSATIADRTSTDPLHQNWLSMPTTLSGGRRQTLNYRDDSVSAQGSVTAIWFSSSLGTVSFENYGWDFRVFNTPTSNANLTQARGGPDWSYAFTATGDGTLIIDYSVIFGGSGQGLRGWQINCTCGGSGGSVLSDSNPTSSGSFTAQLERGRTYSVDLTGASDLSWTAPPGVHSGRMSGFFDWTITGSTIPEPSVWSMMIGGFGIVGFNFRRRQTGFVGRS